MNVRLTNEMEFLAAVWFDGAMKVNRYHLRSHYVTVSTDQREHNIAMDRYKYLIYDLLEHSVFVDQDELQTMLAMNGLGIRVTNLPAAPVDQIINMAIFCKANAVMEDRMTLICSELNSELGDRVTYFCDKDDVPDFFDREGWWHSSDTRHMSLTDAENHDKIIDINSNRSWRELGLEWPKIKKDQDRNTEKVVYADFRKDED